MIISSKTEEKRKEKNITRITVVFFEALLCPFPLPAFCRCSCYSPLRVGKTKIRPLRHLPNAPCPQLGPLLPGYSTRHSSSTSAYNKAWLRERVRATLECASRFVVAVVNAFLVVFLLKLKLMCRKSQVQHAMLEPQLELELATGSSCLEH